MKKIISIFAFLPILLTVSAKAETVSVQAAVEWMSCTEESCEGIFEEPQPLSIVLEEMEGTSYGEWKRSIEVEGKKAEVKLAIEKAPGEEGIPTMYILEGTIAWEDQEGEPARAGYITTSLEHLGAIILNSHETLIGDKKYQVTFTFGRILF